MIQQPIPQPRKRRGKCALIDPEQVRAMIADGRSMEEVGKHFGCSWTCIAGICHDYRIDPPSGRKAYPPRKGTVGGPASDRRQSNVRPEVVKPAQPAAKPAPALSPREAELRATGGRYADLRAWAHKWGTTETKALQEWLKLRLPISKGGAA